MVCLRLTEIADADPVTHGYTELSIIEFTHCFVHQPPLGRPYELLLEPKFLLVLHCLELQLLVQLQLTHIPPIV